VPFFIKCKRGIIMNMKRILILLLILNIFLYSCDSGSSDDTKPDDTEQPDQPDQPDDKNPDRDNYLTPDVDSEGKIIVNFTPKEYVGTVEEGQHMMSVRIPNGYYTSASTLKGSELREELQEIISTGAIKLSYTSSSSADVWDMCEEGDQNPADENQVWQIYTELGRAKNDHSAGVSDEWNREHVWAKSHGDFGTSKGPGTDGHHLRASYSKENSARGNKNFANVNGPRTSNTQFYEPPLSAKGDVARMIFYMAVRYGYKVDNLGTISKEARMGKLEDLLKWNELDPVDPYEIRRNNVIYGFQKNRNPFIDHPELVKYVFGDKKDAAWKE
jgi:endonuclease I